MQTPEIISSDKTWWKLNTPFQIIASLLTSFLIQQHAITILMQWANRGPIWPEDIFFAHEYIHSHCYVRHDYYKRNKYSVLCQWKLPLFHCSTDGRNHKMMNHDMLSDLSCLTAYLGFSTAPLGQNSKCQKRHQEKASWSWSRCWNFPSSPPSVQCNALQCLLWKQCSGDR